MEKSYINYVKSHFDNFLNIGLDTYGREETPMWMSAVDLNTGDYPYHEENQKDSSLKAEEKDGVKPEGCPVRPGKRVYRYIDAPRGSSLYWDQPLLVAAFNLSEINDSNFYRNAARAYVKIFLDKCIAKNGIFLWGNHYYYDTFKDQVVWFNGDRKPQICDLDNEDGHLHEMRPIRPAWEIFWKVDPLKTERHIKQMAKGHLYNQNTGGFNRHADKEKGCAFLEAGGILVETLCWLYSKTGESKLLETAGSIAGFSWNHRNLETGLLENNPTVDRWDKYTVTTEVGFWASCLLRASNLSQQDNFKEMASGAVKAFLNYGFDEKEDKYYGRLKVIDGSPVLKAKTTYFQPGRYSDIWKEIFPSHDYPMPFAESILSLYKITGDKEYEQAVKNWTKTIRDNIPAKDGHGGYAEHYGRCIHFLIRASRIFDRKDWLELAHELAIESIDFLFTGDMFRGHPGTDCYSAVDGVGFLLLALLCLETGKEIDMLGSGF